VRLATDTAVGGRSPIRTFLADATQDAAIITEAESKIGRKRSE